MNLRHRMAAGAERGLARSLAVQLRQDGEPPEPSPRVGRRLRVCAAVFVLACITGAGQAVGGEGVDQMLAWLARFG